jgi:hypothetical protein
MVLPMMRGALAVALAVLASCDGRAPLGSGVTGQAGSADRTAADAAAIPASGGGPVNARPPKELDSGADTQSEVAANTDTPTEPGEPPSCSVLAQGGAPDLLTDFMWQHQVTAGESSAAFDFVWIEGGCTLHYQHQNAERTMTMVSGDCADARSWVTNARFLEVLRTSDGCHTDNGGNATESFELTLTNGEQPRRKTFLCPEPTVEAVRTCLRSLVVQLFPG